MTQPTLVFAHGSHRIMQGDVEIERHGDPEIAQRRLQVHLEKAAAQQGRREKAAAGAASGGAEETVAEDSGEVVRLKKLLEGNVKETEAIIAGIDDVSELSALRAVEKIEKGRKTVLRAIEERAEAIEKAYASSEPETTPEEPPAA